MAEIDDEKECGECGNTLKCDGHAPDGSPEWYHVDSLREIECPHVL